MNPLKRTRRPTPCGPIPPPLRVTSSHRHTACVTLSPLALYGNTTVTQCVTLSILPNGVANMSSKQSLTLSTAARSAIVSSYVKALDAHETSGSLVAQVCETAMRYMKGEEIPEEDRRAIVADIARAKKWTGKSAKSRMSECNVILRAYAKLGEAIEAFRAKAN